jgi:hypothetical protein
MEPMMQTSSTEIARYGGCCKYAFFIRENGPKGNLEARNTGMYVDNWILQCRSTKCRFGKQAHSAKTRDYIDETVFRCHGIEYRWIFLAKSHCAQDLEASDWPYVCLICQLLNHSPQKYKGHQDLFAHIATHQEQGIAGVALQGPLTFSNRGIKADDQFDLNIPEREPPPQAQAPSSAQEMNAAEQLQRKLEDVEIDRNSKTSSLVSAQTEVSSSSAHTDPYANPWV